MNRMPLAALMAALEVGSQDSQRVAVIDHGDGAVKELLYEIRFHDEFPVPTLQKQPPNSDQWAKRRGKPSGVAKAKRAARRRKS